ncbi:PAS domain S-box protein [Acidihalobacter ferrooxydans]|uniref:Sensor protein FixL n=1 Tax=Acidihalobacter ferrooxydans TaxID=1765967 RepID=A0A1P8UK40_9GAMM|nr:PAS domain S-box protein [Acidihalobacter ferrooxydans]APZ44201.1 hypothetical protein BW247_14815 [Acidihalobacter ferrooxydans]
MSEAHPEALRQAVREIADQLCLAVDGRADFTVRTQVADPDAEKLVLLINFLLDSVSRLLEREQTNARELDARVAERSALLKATWDTLTDGLIVVDQTGTVTDCNPATRRLLSGSGEIIGKAFGDFMPEPERGEYQAYLRRYLETGDARILGTTRETAAQTAAGERIPVRLSVSEVNVNGQRQFVGLLRDIRAEKAQLDALEQQRQQVAQSNARLKATWNTLIDSLIVIDDHGIVKDCNPAACALLGLPQQAITERNISDFMPAPYRHAHDGYLRHYLETGEARIIGSGREVEVLRADGTQIPVQLSVSEMNLAGQRQFVGLLRDIRAEKAQLNALHHERQFIERLFDAVPDIIYAFDPQMRFLRWNKQVLEAVGMTDAELAGTRVPQHVAVRDWPRVLKTIQEVFTRGQARTTAHLKTPAGLVPYEFVAARLTGSDGTLLGLVGSGRNIAEREAYQLGLIEARERAEQARQAAEDASLSKSRFLASMSHELRTPLNAVIGYSELILEDLEDGAPSENIVNDLHTIRDAGRHLLQLINDVLDVSRIEAGQMRLHPEPVDPGALTRSLARTVLPLIENNHNRLVLDIPEPAPAMLLSDGGKLRQCLLNLLGNAAKFTHHGEISLSLRRVGEQLVWRVADTGIGMTREEQQRIFEAFVQADGDTDRQYGGSGLGLTLTKQLIELLGGSIEVDSEPGAGSTFRLTLPITPVEENAT